MRDRIRAILASGWGRLGVVAWVVWAIYCVYMVDAKGGYRRSADENFISWFVAAFILPIVFGSVAWWVRLGFLSPAEREARKVAALNRKAAANGSDPPRPDEADFDKKKREFETLITATGLRKTIIDGLEVDVPCILCGERFKHVAGKIELVEKKGEKGFLCQACARKVNDARVYFGLEPFEIVPGTYVEGPGANAGS